MKKIKLNNYSCPVPGSVRTADKFYHVSLGNGYKCSFASEKETLQFLAETSKELNTKLYELNFLYADILRLYRGSWLYFSGSKNIEQICSDKMSVIERAFNLLVDRSTWINGNYLTFNHFHTIINELVSLCSLLSDLFKKRGLTGSVYECESFILRAEYIKTCIVIYPNRLKLASERLQPVPLKKVV